MRRKHGVLAECCGSATTQLTFIIYIFILTDEGRKHTQDKNEMTQKRENDTKV